MSYSCHTVVIAFLVSVGVARAQEDTSRAIIATVGHDVITEQEFRERYELVPGRSRLGGREGMAARMDLAISMVAEKLMAAQGARSGLMDDSTFRSEYESVRRMLARDELYRDEIQRKVSVSDGDIRQGRRQAARLLKIEYYFSEKRGAVAAARAAMHTWNDFSRAVFDTSAGVVHDTITVAWGVAEAALERTVFSLGPREISQPVLSSMGWFVVRILHESRNPDILTVPPSEISERVRNTIRLRREEQRLDEYVRGAVRGFDGRAHPAEFMQLTQALRVVAPPESRDSAWSLSGVQWRETKARLQSVLSDTLLVMGPRSSTVEQVVDRMYASGYEFLSMSYPALERQLNDSFREWTLQSIMESIALQRGLDLRPSVARLLRMWRDFQLAEAYRRSIRSSVRISTGEILAYKHVVDASWRPPTLDVEYVWAQDRSELMRAYSSLLKAGTESDVQSITEALRLGHIMRTNAPYSVLKGPGYDLWDKPAGVWSAPFSTDTGTVVCRVIEKHETDPVNDRMTDSLAVQLLRMKQQRAESVTIAGLAGQSGYAIFEDRLRAMKLSPVPMMTFRLLGFGGRMFAVPFVRPQTDWIEIDQGTQIP